MQVLSLSGAVDGGVRGEARACSFISNQEMNSLRILPGIIRAVDASGCSERCLDTLNHLGFKCSDMNMAMKHLKSLMLQRRRESSLNL